MTFSWNLVNSWELRNYSDISKVLSNSLIYSFPEISRKPLKAQGSKKQSNSVLVINWGAINWNNRPSSVEPLNWQCNQWPLAVWARNTKYHFEENLIIAIFIILILILIVTNVVTSFPSLPSSSSRVLTQGGTYLQAYPIFGFLQPSWS